MSRSILIAGMGRILYFLGRSFLSRGHRVTLISPEAPECERLTRLLRAVVVQGEPSDPAVLEDAEAARTDLVIAATGQDEENLSICQTCARRFGTPRVIALVDDPENETVFRSLGVEAIPTTRMIADIIEQRAASDPLTRLLPLTGGNLVIARLRLGPDAPGLERPLHDLGLPPSSLVACLIRGEEYLVPHGSTWLENGDEVILIARPEAYGAAARGLAGVEG